MISLGYPRRTKRLTHTEEDPIPTFLTTVGKTSAE